MNGVIIIIIIYVVNIMFDMHIRYKVIQLTITWRTAVLGWCEVILNNCVLLFWNRVETRIWFDRWFCDQAPLIGWL